MPRIFISYRRDDSAGYAGRLYDRLSQHFGPDQIFMDIDTIDPGMDFVQVIEEAVNSCSVLIALIGKQWSTITDATGRRRLDNPRDFVRLEIATALDRGVSVIPVLVRDASKPRAPDLPGPLKSLANRSELQISDARFHYDVNRLIEALEEAASVQVDPATEPGEEMGREAAEHTPSATKVLPPYRTLQERLQRGQWSGAHHEAIEIIRQTSGHTRIDSKEKAQAIPAEVLLTINRLWIEADGGPLRDLYWVIGNSEITIRTGWLGAGETWLQKRLKEIGL